MGSNPRTSKWYATPQAKRKRKGIMIYLSDKAKERLDVLAPEGLRSAFVEGLILEAPLPEKKNEKAP